MIDFCHCSQFNTPTQKQTMRKQMKRENSAKVVAWKWLIESSCEEVHYYDFGEEISILTEMKNDAITKISNMIECVVSMKKESFDNTEYYQMIINYANASIEATMNSWIEQYARQYIKKDDMINQCNKDKKNNHVLFDDKKCVSV